MSLSIRVEIHNHKGILIPMMTHIVAEVPDSNMIIVTGMNVLVNEDRSKVLMLTILIVPEAME